MQARAPSSFYQLWRANQPEHACFEAFSPWLFLSRSGVLLHAVVRPWFSLQRSIYLTIKRSAPCSAVSPLVLGCSSSRPLIGVDIESSEVVQKTLHPLFLCLPSPKSPALPTKSPSTTHLGSLASSMRATNLANRIRLLRIIASYSDRKSGCRCDFSSRTDAASQKAVVSSAQRVIVARARASLDAVVQYCYCFQYLGSCIVLLCFVSGSNIYLVKRSQMYNIH